MLVDEDVVWEHVFEAHEGGNHRTALDQLASNKAWGMDNVS